MYRFGGGARLLERSRVDGAYVYEPYWGQPEIACAARDLEPHGEYISVTGVTGAWRGNLEPRATTEASERLVSIIPPRDGERDVWRPCARASAMG